MKKIIFLLLLFSVTLCKAQQIVPPALEWAKCYGGSGDDWASSINQTFDGGYIVSGGTNSNDGDFLGIGVWTDPNYFDSFLMKLDSTGNLEWINKITGGQTSDGIEAFQTLDGGYIMGCHLGTNMMGWDYWIVKTNSTGTLQWEKSYGGSGEDWLNSIIPSSGGGYYLVGESGSNDGDISVTSGFSFTWIVKIDSSGNIIWDKTYGVNWGCHITSAEMTLSGDGIICANSLEDNWPQYSNGGDVANANYLNMGGVPTDYTDWVFKIDTAGNIIWSSLFGPSYVMNPDFLVPLRNGNIFSSHHFYDNGSNCSVYGNHQNIYGYSLNSSGIEVDSFIHSCIPDWSEMSSFGIESSDSLIIFPPSIAGSSSKISKIDFNGNLIWSIPVSDSGKINNMNRNIDGSIVAVEHEFGSQCNFGAMDIRVLKFKDDLGCSIIHTNISASICGGYNYYFNGQNLSTAGVYIDTLNAINSCDSIVTLNLTVETINTTIQQSNDTLIATSIGTIQWFNCNTQQIISGATQNIFVPTVTGNYAAIITDVNCSDTSDCVFISGINYLIISDFVSVYPNPVTSIATIEYQTTQSGKSTVTVENCLGQIILSTKIINNKKQNIDMSNCARGIYFIKCFDGNRQTVVKIVKN